MLEFFELSIISTFLSRFKAKKVLIMGLSNYELIAEIVAFCIKNNVSLCAADSKINIYELFKGNADFIDYSKNINFFNDYSLNILPNLKSFDAIFINDDPNWYTVYNELNWIKKNNSEFPIVFICNNRYPFKRRDAYINPENIPDEFKNECCENLPITYENNNEIKHNMINDGFCHAIFKDTPKNGVLTAIEDFLNENISLKLLDINPLEGISLIYEENDVTKIGIEDILEEKSCINYTSDELSDKFIENGLLLNHLDIMSDFKEDSDRLEEFKSEIIEKNKLINDYKNKIEINNTQLGYKESQINTIQSQLDLKETQLKNTEAKLLNKDYEFKSKISELETKLQGTEKQLDAVNLKTKNYKIAEDKYKEIIESNKKELEKNKKLHKKSENNLKNEVKTLKNLLDEKENKLNKKEKQLKKTKAQIENDNFIHNELKSKYNKQVSKLTSNEYCLKCYEKKINNNTVEIEYLKKSDRLTKKILSPFAYLYILRKSNLRNVKTNINLYRTLKNSECFDIGYYLNKYPDIKKSKWCKYFSPELHYVCEGFDEKRKFNKKYVNNRNKKELIEDILKLNN